MGDNVEIGVGRVNSRLPYALSNYCRKKKSPLIKSKREEGGNTRLNKIKLSYYRSCTY